MLQKYLVQVHILNRSVIYHIPFDQSTIETCRYTQRRLWFLREHKVQRVAYIRMTLIHQPYLLQTCWIINPYISLIICYRQNIEFFVEFDVWYIIKMLFLWLFMNFVRKNILFSDIEGEYFFIITNEYGILKVIFTIGNQLIFIYLELRGLDQFHWAAEP